MRRPVVLLASLVLTLFCLGGLFLLDRWTGIEVDPSEALPGGWWVLDPSRLAPEAREEMGRELSLPYATSTGRRSGSVTGVVYRADEGRGKSASLVVSGHGPEVVLIDDTGDALWRWRMPFELAFPGSRSSSETASFRRARLLPDGSLVAIYQGGGSVRLDRDSAVVWRHAGGFYNDLRVTEDGRLLGLVKEVSPRRLSESQEPFLEDHVVELDIGNGRELARWSILGGLLESRWRGLLDGRLTGDPLHSNTVRLIPQGFGRQGTAGHFGGGDLLVSLRNIDSLAVLRPEDGAVTWLRQGPWRRQHEPVVLAADRWMVFDNLGAGSRTSRVLFFDPVGAVLGQLPPESGDWVLDSSQAGSIQPLEGRHLLVTESYRGQAYELDENGRILWHFVTPFRAGDLGELQAVLFEISRVPWPSWLPDPV